jgi:hypothetical protein
MQSIASTRSSSTCLRRNLHEGATCTTCRRASANLHVRLENPSQTCFHMKQAVRSRRVSHADLSHSILWCNRQTEAHLVLRPKPRNRRGDFDTQITKPKLPVLRPKSGNPAPPWFSGSTKKPTTDFEAKSGETVATSFETKLEKTGATGFEAKPEKTAVVGFEDKPPETVTIGFEAKLVKTVRVVLRPNHSQTVTIGFEA